MQSNDARRSIFRARSTTTISRARLRFLTLMAAWLAVVVPPTPLAAVAVSSDIDPSTAYTSWQWILVQNVPSPCPTALRWSEAPVFATASIPTPEGLRPFCRYTWTGGGPVTAAEVTILTTTLSPFGTLGPDAMAVTQAGDLGDLVWRDLAERFLRTAGQTPLEFLDNGPRPRLTVIDTASDRDSDVGNGVAAFDHTGNSPHGYTLARMAQELLCASTNGPDSWDEGRCVANISTRLALSYLDFDAVDPDQSPRDFLDGGFVGTISELAETIQRAVDDTGRADESRPVLNLSVAWHPRFGGAFERPEDMPPAVRAAYRALEYASCRGAIAIAAAGNDLGGPGEERGPLLPGGWERRPAPSLDECTALLTPQSPNQEDFADSRSYHPLVWAAGGVDYTGEPLGNSREEGMPPMVAYGAHGVVAGYDPGLKTATLTGSSVSSLVVAAAAAAVVQIEPTLPPSEVMKLVWASGIDLAPRRPDFCSSASGAAVCDTTASPRPNMRQVQVCRAAALACDLYGCPGPEPRCPKSSSPTVITANFSSFDSSAPQETVNASPYPTILECGPLDVFDAQSSGLPPEHPCPQRQYHGLQATPWTEPQPGMVPCPNCPMSRMTPTWWRLRVEIASDFVGTLHSPAVTWNGNVFSFPLAAPLTAGDRLVIDGIPYPGTGPIDLVFAVENNAGRQGSATSPILVAD